MPNWRAPPVDIYFSYAPSRQLSTKVRVFADWVTGLIARNSVTADD